jgi:3-deoxy-manno-octulosonate cytidylyltransferase (CMP-KDO synthetase)
MEAGQVIKMKTIGLIPTRLNSTRLPQKALLPMNGLPLVIHTYRRCKLAKELDEVIICCDDKKILKIAQKFKAKAILTSKNHQNGTERIYEGYVNQKKKYDLIVDIQGDEPLISPHHINQVVAFHKKNISSDIILPNLKVPYSNNSNIVKLIFNKKKEVLYLTRGNVPFQFKKNINYIYKHLSIISFLPSSLELFAKSNKSKLEAIEDIELLRAIDIGLKIKTVSFKGDSFSVDVEEDYEKAKIKILQDKYYTLYK